MSADQLDIFDQRAGDAEAPPAWLEKFSALEVAYRARVLGDGGTLARVMQTIERCGLPGREIVELWLWVMSLRTSQGLASNTTTARYAEIVGRYLRWCIANGIGYEAITQKGLDTWLKSLYMDRRNGVSWRRVQLQALRSLYDWRKRMALGPNCTEGVRGPRMGYRTARKYTPAQMRALFQAIDDRAYNTLLAMRDRTLILFLYATGARCAEAGGLRLDQLEMRPKSGSVRFEGKGSKERMVSFDGPVLLALREWLLERDQHSGLGDAVFWSTDFGHGNWGQHMSGSGVERVVKRYAQAAELREWGVHQFRVTYATELYDAGTDIERIRIALGHESIETTRRYLAVSDKQTATRLPAHNQWKALGKAPEGLPAWAERKERQGAPF